MFERFTDRARAVVVTAREEARGLGHPFVGTEHLLLGLLASEGVAGRVLRAAGVTDSEVRADITRRVTPARPVTSDVDALGAIGIDVDAVRAQIERSFGPGALDRAPRRDRRRRRRSGCVTSFGEVRFGPRAKKVLELSLREALAAHDHHIGEEHLLLALLREGDGLAVRILVERDITLDDLRHAVLRAAGRVA